MKLSCSFAAFYFLSLAPIVASSSSTTNEVNLPPNHPMQDVIKKFGQHFRCPYSNEWLMKGPEQAARDLGLHEHLMATSEKSIIGQHRGLESYAMGSCEYVSPFSTQKACVEMRGSSWTSETMVSRCEKVGGTLSKSSGCAPPASFAGWCIIQNEDGATEANPLAMAMGMGCTGMKGLCEGMMSGQFDASKECAGSAGSAGITGSAGSAGSAGSVGNVGSGYVDTKPTTDTTCEIGLGPIGAAHQAGHSTGYGNNCTGTPAEGSPYMLPIRWTANEETQSMDFGSDDVKYQSKGVVYYRFDKNWKRSDTLYQRGRSLFGRNICGPDEPDHACDSDSRSTMLHRGNKMWFIDWKNNSTGDNPENIKNCTYLNLMAVGNIRPDWYLDARGDATDVQYLGDQHIYYENQPRLVKQWRKKDFANQYFTMSMLANTKTDGLHWPLIMNVPGEGFGPDSLRKWTNHSLLSENDVDMFLLDEAYEKIGGTCMLTGGGEAGPPAGQQGHVPSNLEVDTNAWFSSEYTFSPVWKPPIKQAMTQTETVSKPSSILEAGMAVVEACYNTSASAVQLDVTFKGVLEGESELPWIALGYRTSEVCMMNPPDGGNSDIILMTTKEGETTPTASFGPLPREVRGFDQGIISSVKDAHVPLMQADGFSDVDISLVKYASPSSITSRSIAEPDSLKLSFKQSMKAAPSAMNLMYAIGSSGQFGYHKTRQCFQVKEFPSCMAPTASSDSIFDKYANSEGNILKNEVSVAFSMTYLASSVIATVMTVVATMWLL